MNNTNKYILLSMVFIGIILLFSISNKSGVDTASDFLEVVFQPSTCKPQEQVCKVGNNKFNAEIELDKNIFYLKPFNVTVRVIGKENFHIKAIQVDFKMKGMNMGVNRFNLKRKDVKGEVASWKGVALLPVCVSGRADWFSEVEFVTSNKKYVFSFPIEVIKTSN